MDKFSVSNSICSGKYVFTSDHVILATNGANNADIQVFSARFRNGVSGVKKLAKSAELPLSGEATAMELCSITRQFKTYAALARRTQSSSVISLVEILTTNSSASLNYNVSQDSIDTPDILTALTFQPENDLLAASTEGGQIVLFDLASNKEVCRVEAGQKQLSIVKFCGSSQIMSVGDDNKSQVKIWDLRAVGRSSTSLSQSREVSTKCFMPSSGSQKSPSVQYCSLAVHPCLNKFFCGTDSGTVVAWDIRQTAESNVVFRPHLSSVSEVVVHPSESNLLISSSVDGTVKSLNHTDYRASVMAQQSTAFSDDKSSPFTTLMTCETSLSGLDVDRASNRLLAYSRSGGVYTSAYK